MDRERARDAGQTSDDDHAAGDVAARGAAVGAHHGLGVRQRNARGRAAGQVDADARRDQRGDDDPRRPQEHLVGADAPPRRIEGRDVRTSARPRRCPSQIGRRDVHGQAAADGERALLAARLRLRGETAVLAGAVAVLPAHDRAAQAAAVDLDAGVVHEERRRRRIDGRPATGRHQRDLRSARAGAEVRGHGDVRGSTHGVVGHRRSHGTSARLDAPVACAAGAYDASLAERDCLASDGSLERLGVSRGDPGERDQDRAHAHDEQPARAHAGAR